MTNANHYPTLAFLTTKHWATDYGFKKALNAAHPSGWWGNYYQQDKGNKTLLDLITYVDRAAIPPILAYFDMPADTREFIRWVWDWVCLNHPLPKGVEEGYLVFPFPKLYQVYKQVDGRAEYVYVHKNGRLTDCQGQVILLQQPTPLA